MPTLYVRDFPEDLHRKIKSLADKNRRSVSAEVIVLIDEAIKHEAVLEQRAEILKKIADRRRSYTSPSDAADSLTLLSEDRGR